MLSETLTIIIAVSIVIIVALNGPSQSHKHSSKYNGKNEGKQNGCNSETDSYQSLTSGLLDVSSSAGALALY